MESQNNSKMNYLFMPSLKHLALVKIASSLWNHSDIRDLFSRKFSCDRGISRDGSEVVQLAVVKRVYQLQLPRELVKLLISYIHPVVFQIHGWINYHVALRGYITLTQLPKEFFWTPQGNIDSRKIAEILVNDKRLEIYTRFTLSCIYCLEEYIESLLKQLPKGFYKDRSVEEIVLLWSCYVAGEMDYFCDLKKIRKKADCTIFAEFGFQTSIVCGNEVGTRYFLQRLTADNRADLLLRGAAKVCQLPKVYLTKKICFSDYRHSSILCYLLSELDDTQLRLIFCPRVLHYLLNWPWQCLFLRTAKKMWTSLYPRDYYSLLKAIKRFLYEDGGINYQDIFREFWKQGASAYRRHVIMNEGLSTLLPALFKVENTECIKLIFNESTVLEKENFVFSFVGRFSCRILIQYGKWKLLKFFIIECISTKEAFYKLKEMLQQGSSYLFKNDSHILSKFYQFLDDIEYQWKRKYIDDEVSSLTKKLHSSKHEQV